MLQRKKEIAKQVLSDNLDYRVPLLIESWYGPELVGGKSVGYSFVKIRNGSLVPRLLALMNGVHYVGRSEKDLELKL